MTTKKQLQDTVDRINRKSGKTPIEIEYAYGRPAITTAGGARQLSPRLTRGDMALWLGAYEEAVDVLTSTQN